MLFYSTEDGEKGEIAKSNSKFQYKIKYLLPAIFIDDVV